MPAPALTPDGPVFSMIKLATGCTLVVTDEVFIGVVSLKPAGGVKVAVLVNEPVALPETVPLTIKVIELPLGLPGKLSKVALTLLPAIEMLPGQVA
jgi:hypothetical protein